MRCRGLFLLMLAGSLAASEFQSGQAARAVIGQSSFSAHERGIVVSSMAIANGRLYAAEQGRKVLAYDLAKLPDPKEDAAGHPAGGCSVCLTSPAAVEQQSVTPGVAAVSVHGKTVVVADAGGHRVLIWRDASAPRINNDPDVVLGRVSQGATANANALVEPVSTAYDGKRLFVGDAALHRVLVWNTLPETDSQPADSVLGQPDFQSSAAGDTALPDAIGVPAALASDGTNLFVADTAGRRIAVFSAADGVLSPEAITNSASGSAGALAPGSLITVKAEQASDAEASFESDGTAPLPRKLGGTEVVFDGQALPLSAVAEDQVQAQLPYDLGVRSAGVLFLRTEHSDGSVTVSSPVTVKIAQNAPGIFALSGDEPRPGIVLHSERAPEEAGANGAPLTQDTPGRPGEVVTVWATGLGALADPGTIVAAGMPFAGAPETGAGVRVATPVLVRVNGEYVNVISAVLPKGSVGIYEVKIELPKQMAGLRKARLTLVQGNAVSNTVTFPLGA